MRQFTSFLKESIRQGLPHIHSTTTPAGNQTPSLSTDQFHHTTRGGKVHIHDVTEKTDGQTFKFGYDHHGFYTQHSGSGDERIRTGQGHIDRAKRRAAETGKEYVPHAHEAFAKFHDALHNNQKLQTHLQKMHKKHGEVSVRGEAFNRHIATPGDHPHEVKFVHTSYSTHGMGHHGSFVIHSKLPDNHLHDAEHFKKHLSDHNITFDHDRVDHPKGHVDVSHEVKDFHKLDHGLINSRTTPSNKAAKMAEIEKFNHIKHRVHQKVVSHVKSLGIKNKWGSGTEGLIVHPSEHNVHAARFKVVDDSFKKAKASGGRFGHLKENLLVEGGAIKIGDHAAEPIHVTAHNRSQIKHDVHHALAAVGDKFHADHKEHLFGSGHKHLHSGDVYSGSTHHLMHGHVSDAEFAKHKPHVGDIDVQVSHDHKNKLEHTLKAGHKFGKYTVVGTKKHGQELSAVMKHENGSHHQFDFEGNHHPGSEESRFKHNSSWEDTKHGIKGVHHKMLLNAAGRDKHKFSPMNGLRHRADDSDAGGGNAKKVTHSLFGGTADHKHIHSFIGVTHLIKHHVPKSQHQQIYDKFKSSVEQKKNMNHTHALNHLRQHLDVKDNLHEDAHAGEEHAHVAFMGASPFTHMGHHHDVVGSMAHHKEGKKFVGLSGKSDVFSDHERESIANKQSGGKAHFKVEKSAGETVGRAFHSMDKSKRRVLHLHFGHDRKNMAERLKSSIEAGKIPELNGEKPHAVYVHFPHDENRSHGFSGTKMRQAAHDKDLHTFHKHIGPAFSHEEAHKLMHRVHDGIKSGHIPLKR